MIKAALIFVIALPLGGCFATFGGSGQKDVTLETIKIVCLSRKDTQDTKVQVAQNNGALKALGAPKPDCKKYGR